jgi:hypothetical protein
MNTIYTEYFWVNTYLEERNACKTYHYMFGKVNGKKYKAEILKGEYGYYCDLDIGAETFAIDKSNIDNVFKCIKSVLNKVRKGTI